MRPDNEVWISVELFQDMFSADPDGAPFRPPWRTVAGPGSDARIIGARLDPNGGYPVIAVIYDRPVTEPVVQSYFDWQNPPWWERLRCEVAK